MDYLEYSKENLIATAENPEFKEYAKNNPYAEVELDHALDVSKLTGRLWSIKFRSIPPVALKIGGLWHDCDRFFLKEKVDTIKVPKEEYEATKMKHSKNCVRIFKRENPKLPFELKEDTSYMIERHEIGGDRFNDEYLETPDQFTNSYNLNVASDQLEESDGLSFFSVIIPSYAKWASKERVINKIRFSYNKLSPVGERMVREMKYGDKEIRDLVLSTIGS